MKKLFTVVLVLALILVPATALADVTYFEEDFESYPADIGYYPDSFTDYGIAPYTSEVITNLGSNRFLVECTNLGPSAGESSNIAEFTINGDETQVTVEFTFMHMSLDGGVIMELILPYHGVGAIVLPDGSIMSSVVPVIFGGPGTVAPGVPYDVMVVVNLVTSTADFYVNGVPVGTGFPCATATDSGPFIILDAVDVIGDSPGGAVAIVDNILVTGLYTEPVNPRTGDTSGSFALYVIISMLALSFAGFALRRKLVKSE